MLALKQQLDITKSSCLAWERDTEGDMGCVLVWMVGKGTGFFVCGALLDVKRMLGHRRVQ